MTASQGELNAAAIIANLDSKAYPRDVVVNIARGFLPLPQEDLIAVLAHIITTGDLEIAEAARTSLTDIPSRIVHAFASNESAPPEHLARLITASTDGSVLEALIRNRAVSDDAVVELARRADAHGQEVIVINHARILRAPQILEALLENPNLTVDARRRALEAREEFFDKKARVRKLLEELEGETGVDEPDDAIADLLAKAEEEAATVPAQPTLPPPPSDIDDRHRSMWARLLNMSVSEKVQLAFKGDKSVRTVLIRDRNRLIATATVRNPRMTENEVESIAGMRNVEEEVLRLIAMKREWSSKYPIALALARNPKAPIGVVLPLINRLTLRDLKSLKDDKGVAEVIRTAARKLYQIRQP